MYLAGCRNNIIKMLRIKIAFRLRSIRRMAHGAWGLNCRENNICANKNIVLNFRISRVLTLSTNCPMPHALCSMPKIENIIKFVLNSYNLFLLFRIHYWIIKFTKEKNRAFVIFFNQEHKWTV
jgi:hypothetical protein